MSSLTEKTLDRLYVEDKSYSYYSLVALEKLYPRSPLHRFPISIRILLESLLRNIDEQRVTSQDLETLLGWSHKNLTDQDIPFVVSRVILQDFTGVPLLVDLAAMRDALAEKGLPAQKVEPKVPVHLVIDHSVQVDAYGSKEAFSTNLAYEFARNEERYRFLKWGEEAFSQFSLTAPGTGIVHQVNLEYLASVVCKEGNLLYPDSLVGTDSHTTMIGGLGVVGWGVGGIEAEAAMLGQPISLQLPEVIGVEMRGSLSTHVTSTDLTLYITELLRKEKVVGKFVEFFGEGTESLSVADRATIANMAPEYGATIGFFPVDKKTLEYLALTGRDKEHLAVVEAYYKAQKLWGIPKKGEVDYSRVIEVDLDKVEPSIAGPKRPQDRIPLKNTKKEFEKILQKDPSQGGYGKIDSCTVSMDFTAAIEEKAPLSGGSPIDTSPFSVVGEVEMINNRPLTASPLSTHIQADNNFSTLSHGSIVIAAITSCTNTSNPSLMVAAGLLAKKAVEKGLKIAPSIKTSFAPGSRVVSAYLDKAGLQPYLDALGFQVIAYGCTTCIGNSGPLEIHVEKAIQEHDLIVASVLSGNRNFESRIHSLVKANFLMSPPLVVAFALAGKVDIDFAKEPIGYSKEGEAVFLQDIWPSSEEVEKIVHKTLSPLLFDEKYRNASQEKIVLWEKIGSQKSAQFPWNSKSLYIQKPPYFENFSLKPPELPSLSRLRLFALFGDSVTTDHISPAGAISSNSCAGQYLQRHQVLPQDFNSYGSRRGSHDVMIRGTFANKQLKNRLVKEKEGGWTKLMPENKEMYYFDASEEYRKRGEGLIIFGGRDYGMGSSRDWAAKGTALLGVKVVVVVSFERIHRSNLVGMGILPLEFIEEKDFLSLSSLTGEEEISIKGIDALITPRQKVTLQIVTKGKKIEIPLRSRIDTKAEVQYYLHGGIMPFVLRQLSHSA